MQQKVVLVTGASSGIGAAIAQRLAADGHRVFGTARKPSGSAAPGIEMLALDVCSDQSARACVESVLSKAGRLDALVNNAGYLLAGAIEEATMDEARAQFETNFFGVVRMVKAVLPRMRQQKSGHIVTISSLAGLVPPPFWGFYSASKFAVEGYCETLRTEMKPFGIKVAIVEPGAIKTPIYANPKASPMAEYEPWRSRALKTMKMFEERAPGPELVAKVVSKIVRSENPKLRTRVTREAIMFDTLRSFLPGGAFETGLRIAFNLDKQGY